VAERVKSLRNPSDKAFEDHTPSGRVYRIGRRRVAAGGTVTVMTDITELKRAEQELLEAKQRTEEANKLVTDKNQTLESLSSKLSKYLSPQIYDSIFSGAQTVEIASRRKKLTIFFSDIAAFTETTDNLESEELTDVLNHYLTEMSTIALEYGATIDKYIGDAILLFFGDPKTKGVKEDAMTCVMMAIAMQRRMRELEYEWRTRGLERPFRIRMGICTGFCTVGNFGSRDRMDYTIIGNEVNLAARLESAAEPGSIMVAHETNSLVEDKVLTEEQPPMTVKGFMRPIKNYKVVGTYDELVDEGRVVLRERDGLRVLVDLTKQDKSEAIAILEEVVSQLKD
jgi:class 3 adenylate cyclase